VFARHESELGRQSPARFTDARFACLAVLRSDAPAVFAPPRLVKTVGVYNIVCYGQRFYGLPQALGPVDLAKENVDGRAGVVVGRDLVSVEQRVAHLSNAG
jgi:hypothetical protein